MDYPYDIITEFTRNKNGKKTFNIAANFVKETEESPLKIFGQMTRFTVSILNGRAANMNVHPSDLAGMRSISEFAMSKYYEKKYMTNSETENLGPAFTKRFQLGNLKGKSPVDVLKENGENGKNILNEQYSFLKSNLEKYPNNKELMDAIVEASKLVQSDYEKISSSSRMGAFNILTISCRGNIRKERSDKKCPCYEGEIVFDMSRNLPVSINIKNYYAPIRVNDDKTQNVITSEMDKDSLIQNSFSMSAECWMKCLKEMEEAALLFKMLHAKEAFLLADKAFSDNRSAVIISQQ